MLSGFPASRNLPRLPTLFRFCGFGEPDLEFCTSGRVPAQRYVPPFTPVISLSFCIHSGFRPQVRCGHLLGSPAWPEATVTT